MTDAYLLSLYRHGLMVGFFCGTIMSFAVAMLLTILNQSRPTKH